MNNWNAQIDKTTNEFQHHFGSLSQEELNWKPNSETWSIAQNIDHLIVINQSYFPILADLHSGNLTLPFISKFGFIVSFFGKTVLNSVKPDKKKKVKTFPIWEPAKSNIGLDIIEKFSIHQNELKRQIENSNELIKNDAIIFSPANKYFVYKLETAFDIIVAHEKRHLEQAKEVLIHLKKMLVT